MSDYFKRERVRDSVAKVNDEVAVGENLEFQRKWWKFEQAIWILFALIVLFDLSGLLGRGPLAKAERRASDGSIDVKYERIERLSTPSIVTVMLDNSAIVNGNAELYVSESMVKELGAQRVVPSPAQTAIGDGGLTYTFPVTHPPASVEFALEPTGPGMRHLTLRAPGMEPVHLNIFVMP